MSKRIPKAEQKSRFFPRGKRKYWWFSRHASKLNYHASENQNRLPFNKLSQEIEYRRRVINKQRAKVLGMCGIPNSSYSAKGFTKNYRVLYGNAMLVLSKRLFSLLNLKTFAQALLSTY